MEILLLIVAAALLLIGGFVRLCAVLLRKFKALFRARSLKTTTLSYSITR
ncbi:MAG: hypothetical protein LBQ52_03145 [Helicobacteraceae bacterium]|jgi:hypothetical protein|nr:hypothetical protein [Helicobacteraceae bacterium]